VSVLDRVLNWLRELKEKEAPVEVISFYNELPVRCKVRVLDLDREFVQWESNPKLLLAVEDCGRLYVKFNDPAYGQERILGADVTYRGSSMVETTVPKPYEDPSFRRETLRVTVSPTLPVKVTFEEPDPPKQELQVRDLSEGGIGVIGPKELFKLGDRLKFTLELPFGSFSGEAEVVSVEPFGDKMKYGLKFTQLPRNARSLLNRYVMARQREILDKIRMIAE